MKDNKKPAIEIREENVGKFTEWCKRHGYKSANAACEEEGLASKNATIRKRANFSRNAKKWNKG
jgi:hypothetical protein